MDKQALRERVWDDLEESGEARFPFPPHGRIPNFAGAEEAADRLAAIPAWQDASTVKANPDAPQLPARRAALRAGKTVYMAVPRLRDERCFYRLDPADLDDLDAAATVSGVDDAAERVGPEAVDPVDLVLVGSVAVTPGGARVGKGEGFSDLEYAVLTELGLVTDATPVATTVHERQLVGGGSPDSSPADGDHPDRSRPGGDYRDDSRADGDGLATVEVDAAAHDVPMDVVVTPERVVRTETTAERPTGIDWDLLSGERIEEIPALQRLRAERDRGE